MTSDRPASEQPETPGRPATSEQPAPPERLAVAKTCKLFLGGTFPRSESGRVLPVHDSGGAFLANVSQASRKDVRDAVSAARKAFPGWAGASAHNRGQVLFRVAEVLEGRREQFRAEVAAAEGVSAERAARLVDAAVDRVVWFAGWTDKLPVLSGGAHPVAGPYSAVSAPEPVGVVGVLAPQESSLLGLVSVLAPVLAAGDTCVLVASEQRPLPAVSLAEVLATSDVPAGAANVLTGRAGELAPVLAAHADVDALDPAGLEPDGLAEAAEAAAGTAKRVLAHREAPDWTAAPSPARLRALTTRKTTWHPTGT